MDHLEAIEATVQELLAYGDQQCVDLRPILNDIMFAKNKRWVFFWRKESGIHYNMQGRVKCLPMVLQNSAGAFRGMWSETGAVNNIVEAFALLTAWIIDEIEVDALPVRIVRSCGIG